MVLPIRSGYVEVFKPTNSSTTPDAVLKPPDLREVSITREVQDASGKASINYWNPQGKYAGEITAGDRLEIVIELGGIGASSSTRFGHASYGRGTYGSNSGTKWTWTGMANRPRYSYSGEGTRAVSLDAEPFVFGVLGSLGRKVDNAFRNRSVTYIAKTIIEDEAPVLDTSGIDTFSTTYDVEYDGTPLLKALAELADVVNAVLSGQGKTVYLQDIDSIPNQWTANDDDFEGGWEVDPVDDHVWNHIRIEGGSDNDIGDQQLTQSSYQTVTESNRISKQISLPKSRTDEIRIWTNPTGSQENLTVRVQEDKNGSPTDITDQTKDLVNKELSQELLTHDGFTTFLLKPTILPDSEPWLIIESGGMNGQDIGVDSNGVPTHKSFYFYPIITERQNQASINEYRRREKRIEQENITTVETALELAQSKLRHHNMPRKEFSTNAGSIRAHRLSPAEILSLDFPEETATGKFIVTTRTDTFGPSGSRNQLQTELRLEEVATF